MSAANRHPPESETAAAAAAAAAESAGPADGAGAGPASGHATARPKVRHKRYPLMNQLSAEQVGHFRTVANTYIPDMYDPAAVEVLLVVLEICHILDLTPAVVEQIFGVRVLAALETWGDLVPPRRRCQMPPVNVPRIAGQWVPEIVGQWVPAARAQLH